MSWHSTPVANTHVPPRRTYTVTTTDKQNNCDLVGKCIKNKYFISSVFCICALLILILVPMSFQYVEPGEIALSKGRVSGDVDETGKVYKMNLDQAGRYREGPSIVFQKFDARIQQNVFDLDVVASNSRGFVITVVCFYKLNDNELGLLYNKYNTEWITPAKNTIIKAIKGVAPRFSINDYVNNLNEIREDFAFQVKHEIEQDHMLMVNMEVLILRCDFTSEVDEQFLQAVIQEQNNQRQLIQRDVDVIAQETETERRGIVANTSLITATGEAIANRIVNTGQAEANRIIRFARTEGFTLLFDHFNVTNSTIKSKFLKWYAMSQNIDDIHLLVGVNNALVQIPP